MARPGRPPTSTPRGCSGVILGDARGTPAGQRPGRHRRRLDRRDRADPAPGRGGQARRVRRAAAAAARLPGRDLVADRPARRPGRRPARRARAAPDHRRRRRHAAARRRRSTAVRGVRAGQHRPGLDPAHAVAGAARGRARPAPAQGHRRRRSPPSGSARAPTCSSPGWPTGSRSRSTRTNSRGPGHHRGRARDQGGADPDLARATAGWRRSPPPASPTGRSRSSGASCPSCSPRSCAGSTRTTCTPRPRRSWSRAGSRRP